MNGWKAGVRGSFLFTTALKEIFQHALTQCVFEMAGIVYISEDEDGQGFDVKVDWVGCYSGPK